MILLSHLLILTGGNKVWGQTDFSGTYYLAMPGTGSYNASTPVSNYYLVPTEGWCYYVATNNVQAEDNGQPFLTTYKCGHVSNAKWTIQKHPSEEFYYIIHFADGKYLTYNGTLPDASANRARVHLEASATGNNNLFAITTTTTDGVTSYFIASKTEPSQYLNVTDGNKNSYAGASGKTDGPTGYKDVGGIIGRWNDKNNTSQFRFEPTTTIDAPTITNNNDGTFTITAATGATIYYTTDGTVPTLSSYTGSGTTPVTVNQTPGMTVIKAIAKAAGDAIATDVTTYELPACDAPVISFDNTTSLVSITSAATGTAFYYTTDGGTPTASSTGYSSPFSVTSPTTVKAIATQTSYAPSTVTTLVISQVATPTIQNNGSNAISITSATAGATIYYTTDGSTPTTSSTIYSSPLTDNVSNATIKAIAVKEGMITSAVGSGTVVLQCATPVITRVGLSFTLACSMPTDANLYYTLEGGSEMAYTGTPVSFTLDQLPITVTAVARHSDYTDSGTATMELNGGSGTPADPYMIYGANDFSDFVTNVNAGTTASASYKLGTDVSASGFTTIATTFSGTLEAAINPETQMPYRITGLDAPLFTTLTGTVKNLVLEDVNISGNTGNTGAIACTAEGSARIYNVGILSGEVGGTTNTGGLVGYLDGTARVINCYSYANVTSGTNTGGIVGYNNVASSQSNVATMVMNCMFYGTISSGGTISPIYGGENIDNKNAGGLATYNYYLYRTDLTITDNKYNCALAVEEKYLTRFEFYRQLENSNKKLASIYATGSAADADQKMLKWVLETADRTISDPKPYPVLKAQGYYPSIINYDADNAPDSVSVGRNHGGKLGSKTLSVSISGVGSNAPSGASITTNSLTLQRTDKDFDRFNYNYDKVQLPYYNDVGTGNYTGNRVVTGWKITAISGGTAGTYSASDAWGGYNFADRKCTNKDKFDVSGRVFSQGAYFEVPYGVTGITIEPYWGVAAYVCDQYYDVVYKENGNNNYSGQSVNVASAGLGTQATNNTNITINGSTQKVYTSIENARNSMSIPTSGKTVYDYAVVLVGNVHQAGTLSNATTPYTITSVDLDKDNEPDYSFIFSHYNRQAVSPIRFDFLNVVGTAQAQKPNGTSRMLNVSIFKPKGWFEVTNTCNMYLVQFEGYNGENKTPAPIIFLGGVVDQFTSTQNQKVTTQTQYIHLGSNCWFKAFGNGTHSDGWSFTSHVPVSVTGGDFEGFYLSGVYRPDAGIQQDDAECYISSGRFNEVAGAAQQMIDGDVHWQIYNADITNFYGGGINAAKPVTGDITVDIANSYVDTYCGGPKFGDMQKSGTTFTTKYSTNQAGSTTGTYSRAITKDGKVTTNATGCEFNKFFGAGYGGTSYSELKFHDAVTFDFSNTGLPTNYTNDRGKYFNGQNTSYKSNYGNKGPGVATDFSYEFFVWSSGQVGARFYVKYASFSLAKCNDVESNLKNCSIKTNFYGGGSIGKVDGTATSELENCTVLGSVYAGGYSASLPTIPIRSGGFATAPNFNNQSGMFEPGVPSPTTDFDWTEGTLTQNALAIDESSGKHTIYTDVDLTTLGEVTHTELTIKGTTTVGESIYGGGEEGNVSGNVTVNMQGGTVGNDVYGGGALANTNMADENNDVKTKKTTVNLHGGTVNRHVFGGGLGRKAATGVTPVAAIVYGDVEVKLNETVATDNCIVKGDIFGCNNYNGTPKGTATVHVYKTVGYDNSHKKSDTKDDTTYDLNAVYGGGNEAAYEPSVDAVVANVIIEGCDLTSIKTVYGGGNAASAPGTHVLVNSCYEIGTVFGGGNGLDAMDDGTPNPGANVGYKAVSYTYSFTPDPSKTFEENAAAEEAARAAAEAAAFEAQKAALSYGTGEALVELKGGTIHKAFGGSNTKGNVRVKGTVDLNEPTPNDCSLSIEEVYGAGNEAEMDGSSEILLGCVSYLSEIYGGARKADINNNVVLNIQSGRFDRVFGGNNIDGTISGTITVNIEETGCHPIIIGQLYGGGNMAPYTAPTGQHGPTVNAKSFTSIGEIYGGGYGAGAIVTGDTYVNVNECVGDNASIETESRTIDGQSVTVSKNTGTTVTIGGVPVEIPLHKAGEIGAIGTIFGGGNAAKVVGNTNVKIGTETTMEFVTPVGTPVADRTKNVVGVDIRKNVYGGGNAADVTGNTNVLIGK